MNSKFLESLFSNVSFETFLKGLIGTAVAGTSLVVLFQWGKRRIFPLPAPPKKIETTPELENKFQFRVAEIYRYPVKGLKGCKVDSIGFDLLGLDFDRRFMIINENNEFVTQRHNAKIALIQTTISEKFLTLSDGVSETPLPPISIPLNPTEKGKTLEAKIWGSTVTVVDQGDQAAHFLNKIFSTKEKPTKYRLVRAVVEQGFNRPVKESEYHVEGCENKAALSDGYPFLLANKSSLEDLQDRLKKKDPSDNLDMLQFRPNIVLKPLNNPSEAAWHEDRWTKIKIRDVTFHLVKPCKRCTVVSINQDTAERHPQNEPHPVMRECRQGAKGQFDLYFGWNLIHDKPGKLQVGDTVEILETRTENHSLVPNV